MLNNRLIYKSKWTNAEEVENIIALVLEIRDFTEHQLIEGASNKPEGIEESKTKSELKQKSKLVSKTVSKNTSTSVSKSNKVVGFS